MNFICMYDQYIHNNDIVFDTSCLVLSTYGDDFKTNSINIALEEEDDLFGDLFTV